MGGSMNRMDYLRQLGISPASRHRGELLEEAFAACQDRLLGMLYCLLGTREDACKAFQESFAKCWRRLDSAADSGDLEPWIFRVSLNVGRDLRGSAWRRRPLVDEELPGADVASGAAPTSPDSAAPVRRVLLSLGREEQEVFLLRQDGRMTYDQIAQAVNIPLNSVKTRMQLALSKLWDALAKKPAAQNGADSSQSEASPAKAADQPASNAEKPVPSDQVPSSNGEKPADLAETNPAVVGPDSASNVEPGQRLLELVYELLTEEEAAELRAGVAADPNLAQMQAEAAQAARLFAEAARLEMPRIELRLPHRPAGPRPASGPSQSARKASRANGAAQKPQLRRLTRGANWAVAIGSLILLVVSVGGFFYHRGQLADIAAENLRLLVLGPARLRAGVAQEYTVITTSVTGSPVSAQVEFAFFPPVGERMGHLQRTDDQGRLRVTIPADRLRPGKAKLEIRAKGRDQNQMERVETQVVIEPAQYVTRLTLDKPLYRPGDTVRYRSLTLTRFGLSADRETPIQFDILNPEGAALARSTAQGITQRGVGCGQFSLAADLAPGSYTLVAKSLDDSFPTQRKAFVVQTDGPSPLKPAAKKERAKRETAKEAPKGGSQQPAAPDSPAIEVDFFPESGQLVAEMENRVYFAARDAQGRPVAISGKVLETGGRPVARVETTFEGMGVFVMEPRVGELYRLKIDQPSTTQRNPRLPEVVSTSQVVLTTGLGVFPPGKPLEFNIRVAEAGIPLVATAWCRGATVGEQAIVTEATANSVSIPLADGVSGALRLAIYDYRFSPPRRVAERLVYRQPIERLDVRIAPPDAPYVPGKTVQLALQAHDENGKPAPAALSVAVVERAGSQLGAGGPAAFPLQFLLGDEIENLETPENASMLAASGPKADAALDLVLATRGWQRLWGKKVQAPPREERAEQAARSTSTDADTPAPAVFDNLIELQARYQGSLASYRANRTRLLNTLTVLSFFGGGGLVLLVAMLSLLGITTGVRLWTTSLAVAAICLILGARLMNPERLKAAAPSAVSFAAVRTTADTTPLPSSTLAETVSLKSLRPFPVEAAHQGGRTSATTLFWAPLVRAGVDGRARVRFDLPASPGNYRVTVEAHSSGGRLGAATADLTVGKK